MRNYKTQIYIQSVTHKYRKSQFNPSFAIIVLFRELCVFNVISFSIFTVQPQNVGRVHLRIAEENYYNGKRCSNKHLRDGMTIFCSIHLSWFHVTKSPRKRREGTWHISVVFSSTSVSQEGRSHELYIRERENDRHD